MPRELRLTLAGEEFAAAPVKLEREKLYEQAAHHIVDTDGKTQEEIAEEIAIWWEHNTQ